MIQSREDILEESFADDTTQNYNCRRDLWCEVKNVRKNKSGCNKSVDDLSSSKRMASHFASKDKDSYVSVTY